MSGPADNYDSGVKSHYRRRMWNLLESREPLRSIPKPDRVLLILDEWEAHESKFLIEERGYRPDQIHVAQLKPAKAARVSLSLHQSGHYGVRTHSRGLGSACRAMADEGIRVHAIHADFCANITSPDLADALCDIRALVPNDKPTVVAVNMLRGRETDLWRLKVESFKRMGIGRPEDAVRVRLAMLSLSGAIGDKWACCECHASDLKWDTYKSTNGQTMLFLACTLRTHGTSCADASAISHLLLECDRRKARQGWTDRSHELPVCSHVDGLAGRSEFERLISMSTGRCVTFSLSTFKDRFDAIVQDNQNDARVAAIIGRDKKRYSNDPMFVDNVVESEHFDSHT